VVAVVGQEQQEGRQQRVTGLARLPVQKLNRVLEVKPALKRVKFKASQSRLIIFGYCGLKLSSKPTEHILVCWSGVPKSLDSHLVSLLVRARSIEQAHLKDKPPPEFRGTL
jgi:hypothetical protein